jgi:hypothetical protein
MKSTSQRCIFASLAFPDLFIYSFIFVACGSHCCAQAKVFVEIIVLQNGPPELVSELANAIEDPELRFKTCIQFCHKERYQKQLWMICAEVSQKL